LGSEGGGKRNLAAGALCLLWQLSLRTPAIEAANAGERSKKRMVETTAAKVAVSIWSGTESFLSSLKTHRTRDAPRADLFDYVERSYNPKRRHSTLGYLSPITFEEQEALA
jgi:transposase InsO family protein